MDAPQTEEVNHLDTDEGRLAMLEQKIDRLTKDMHYLVEHQRVQADLFTEMGPIAREAMSVGADRLQDLEQRGYFTFVRQVLQLLDKVVTGFSEEDVEALGDNIVRILQTVKSFTQPEVMSIAGEAGEVLQNADQIEPVGVVGMVKATHDDDVQRGMALMVEMLRQMGRASSASTRSTTSTRSTKSTTSKPAAPRSGHATVPGIKPSGRYRRSSPAPTPKPRTQRPSRAAASSGRSDPMPFIPDSEWSREDVPARAAEMGLQLTDAHWALIDFARKDYHDQQASPNIRRITAIAGVTTRELYQLFPKAPARTVAKLAGIPKPAGCL